MPPSCAADLAWGPAMKLDRVEVAVVIGLGIALVLVGLAAAWRSF
jgi:hypothetical protein